MGIPIRLDASFMLVLPLFAWIIGRQVPGFLTILRQIGVALPVDAFQQEFVPYLLGLAAAIGLFISVLVHELGHAATARLYGVKVREIRLWFLGGIANLDELPRQRGAEAVVAIVGPITSGLLGFGFWLTARNLGGADALLFLSGYLAITNLSLALFNLLPALPLDGGRVLRSLLTLALPPVRATRIAGGISRMIAILLGIYGFMSTNILLLAIAFFIYNAVRAETQYALIAELLEGLSVGEIMTREVISVDPDMHIGQFRQLMFYRRHVGYPVVADNDRLVGFALIGDAKDANDEATVASIMIEPDTVPPDMAALDAMQLITSGELGRLLVVDRTGELVGVLSKTDLIRTLQLRSEARG